MSARRYPLRLIGASRMGSILWRNSWSLAFVGFLYAFFELTPIFYLRLALGPVLESFSDQTLLISLVAISFVYFLGAYLNFFKSHELILAVAPSLDQFKSKIERTSLDTGTTPKQIVDRFRKLFFVVKYTAETGLNVFLEAPVALACLIFIGFIHPIMAIACFFGIGVIITMWLLNTASTKKLDETEYRASFEADKSLRALIDATTLHADPAAVTAKSDRWHHMCSERASNRVLLATEQNKFVQACKVVMVAQGSVLMATGAILILGGSYGPDNMTDLIIAKFLAMLAIRPFVSIATQWQSISRFTQFFNQLDAEPTPEITVGQKFMIEVGELEATNINFSYKKNESATESVIRGLSFKISPGTVIELTGNRGAGKTTLMLLIMGHIRTLSGQLKYSKIPLHNIPRDQFRKVAAYIGPETAVFSATVLENIIGDLPFNKKRFKNLCSLIPTMDVDKKLYSHVDEIEEPKVLFLIELMRALYGNSRILLIDLPEVRIDSTLLDKLAKLLSNASKEGRIIFIVTTNEPLKQICTERLEL